MWAAGLFSLLMARLVAPLGEFSNILGRCCLAAVAALAITPPGRLGISQRSARLLLLLGTVGLFVGDLNSGSKAFIMFSFVPIFWRLVLDPRLRRWLPIAGLCAGIFFMYIVLPVVTVSRLRPKIPGEAQIDRIVQTAESMWYERDAIVSAAGVGPQDALYNFLHRSFDPITTGFLVAEVRYRGFQNGSRLVDGLLYAFIPRILWPDKPMITPLWFLVYLHEAKTPETATNAIGPSFIGDLYWNFGLAGVVLGSLLVGLLLGKLWSMAGNDPRGRPLHLLLYVIIVLNMPSGPDITTKFLPIIFDLMVFKALFVAATIFTSVADISRRSRLPALAKSTIERRVL